MEAWSCQAEPTARCRTSRQAWTFRYPCKPCATRASRLRSMLLGPVYGVEEIQQGGIEGKRLREVRAMSGVRNHDLLRVRNPVRKRVRRGRDERHLMVADDHKRRNFQRRKLRDAGQRYAPRLWTRIKQILTRVRC